MSSDEWSEVVDFDAEAALSTANRAIGDENVFSCVVYDDTEFRTVYVDERVDDLYADVGDREEHFGEIHSYVHLDFSEQALFEELFRDPAGVRAFVTYMGTLIAVRVVHDRQGLFLSVAPTSPVTKLVTAVESDVRT